MPSIALGTIAAALQALYLLGAFALLGVSLRWRWQSIQGELRDKITIPTSGLCVCTTLAGSGLTAMQHVQVFILALLFALLAYQAVKTVRAERAGMAA